MNEKSNIFYPILQFNSKVLKILPDNCFNLVKEKIKKLLKVNNYQNYAYTISLENIEEMKSHLLSIEENYFFIITKTNNLKFYGQYNKYSKITVINQYNLCKDVDIISDNNKKRDYAFALNMVFSHERMCHGKEGLCNQETNSPCIYFNLDFKKDYIYSTYSKVIEGEAGRVLENFIAHPILIKSLKVNKKYGNYLDYKYFIGDFREIKEEAMKNIKNDSLYKEVKNKKLKSIKINSSIFILIFSILFYIKYYLNKNLAILLLLLISIYFLILILKDYIGYNDPFKDNDTYYDIINQTSGNNDDEKDGKVLIYPDDYPFESDTFFGRYFPFIQFEKNKIRKKLKKYTSSKNGNYY